MIQLLQSTLWNLFILKSRKYLFDILAIVASFVHDYLINCDMNNSHDSEWLADSSFLVAI